MNIFTKFSRRIIFGTFTFCSILASGPTHAALVSIDSLVASWINVNPVATVTVAGNGTSLATMRWGTTGQSGYNFSTATTPFSYVVPPNSPTFAIGEWTHLNNPIAPPSLASATLVLTAGISVDGTDQGTFDFLFDFTHDETTNADNPCANSEANNAGVNINGCADIVDIAFNSLSESFEVDGELFTLHIAPGSTHFETIEGQNNAFDINANITSRSTVVPEPASLALLGLGLAGLGFSRRRTNKA